MGKLKNKKVIPTFNAASAHLNTNHGRVWKKVAASSLQVGDIVANVGEVIYTQVSCRDEVLIEAGQPQSKEFWYASDDIVFAFVKER